MTQIASPTRLESITIDGVRDYATRSRDRQLGVASVSDSSQGYKELMELWSAVAASRGLSHEEVAVVASQFAGIVTATAGLSADGQARMLKLLAGAMSTACANNALKAPR